jgi:nucleoid DNA-binding protein
MPMTQAEFETAFQENLEVNGFEGLSKADIRAILETLGDTVEGSLRAQMPRARKGRKAAPQGNGQKAVVVLRGLGRLTIVDRPARMGRNPQTGEAIKIAASKKMRMTVAKPMRDSLGVK